ncbi:hypothetical protein [Dyella psychrodurans]|uniref:hypothetical protein n=1 Tax=Dyella psychrodurans TaxID=1927960 RepID=UPI0011C02556|nr:hypothetical protein [Dyella psychrodurans]
MESTLTSLCLPHRFYGLHKNRPHPIHGTASPATASRIRQLTVNEVEAVNGAMTMDQGLNVIGGIAAVCGVIPGLQGAAAFAGGVYLGGELVELLAD